MKSFRIFTFLYIFSLISTISFSQPAIQWQKCLGGANDDFPFDIIETSDSGYVVAGRTNSYDGDVSVLIGGVSDYWIVKLNALGNIQWEKTFGGTAAEDCFSIKQTKDNGFILAGKSNSNDVQVSGNHGGDDYWIVKIDSSGNLQWQKSLGGSSVDWAEDIILSTDNGYVVCGWSASNNGMVTGNHGIGDYWVIKMDSTGNLLNQKCLGGTGYEYGFSICNTLDSGYVVLGRSNSNDGNVTANNGGSDYWMVKLDSAFNILWQQNYGGSLDEGVEFANFRTIVIQTADSGFAISGGTLSNDSDITFNHGDADFWVIKTDPGGIIQWQKCYGGSSYDFGNSIQQTQDGGFIMVGSSASDNFDVTNNHGDRDYWAVRIDANGTILWQKTMGGSNYDMANTIRITSDGGYVLAGYTDSNDGDVTGYHGINEDMWVVKLQPDSITGISSYPDANSHISIYPNPFIDEIYVTMKAPQKLTVYNLLSQTVYERTAANVKEEKTKVNLSSLVPGIYLINISGENQLFVQKILKQ